jgi:hypothetical protein
VPYEMRGRFLEACDCSVPCPCWFEQDPEDDECRGLIAWVIERGEIDGVDVSGLTTVSVSSHGGHRTEQSHHMRVALFVDESASDEQRDAIERAFTGKLGGPLGELADYIATVEGVESAEIDFATDGAKTKLVVGRKVRNESKLLTGSTDRVITIADGVMSKLLSPVGEVGRSSSFRMNLPGTDDDIDVEGRSTTSGRFSYRHH